MHLINENKKINVNSGSDIAEVADPIRTGSKANNINSMNRLPRPRKFRPMLASGNRQSTEMQIEVIRAYGMAVNIV